MNILRTIVEIPAMASAPSGPPQRGIRHASQLQRMLQRLSLMHSHSMYVDRRASVCVWTHTAGRHT